MIPFGRTALEVLIRNSFGNKVLWGEAEGMGLEGSRIRGGSRIGYGEPLQMTLGRVADMRKHAGQQSVCDLNMVCSGVGAGGPLESLGF